MISQSRADACVQEAARPLIEMSYQELKELAERVKRKSADEHWEVMVDGEAAEVCMMIGETGVLCRRICVELVLASDYARQGSHVPGVYFERFKSGRLYVARAYSWYTAAVYALYFIIILFLLVVGLYAARSCVHL